MRFVAALLIAFALFAAGTPASAQTTKSAPAASQQSTMSHGQTAAAGDDSAMRTMYVAMGAMTGYMVAVMPVTTSAIVAAVSAGVATMWAYDYVMYGAVQ